jgi:hypothetical protein
MNEGPVRTGVLAVIRAASVSIATLLFLPGVLVRVGCQLVIGIASSAPIKHRDFVTELGGEIDRESAERAWTKLLVATIAGPVVLGSVLLLPTIVRWSLLDVRPFAALTVDAKTVVTRSNSVLPYAEAFVRYGPSEFLRLWFGVSCFYCCVPSANIITGAAAENRSRRRSSPIRLLIGPVILACRLLRGIDALLTYGFAGAYLASGLIVLLLGWRVLAAIARTVF